MAWCSVRDLLTTAKLSDVLTFACIASVFLDGHYALRIMAGFRSMNGLTADAAAFLS